MKKHIVLLMVGILLMIFCSCDSKTALSEKETQALFDKAISVFDEDKVNTEHYIVSVIGGTDNGRTMIFQKLQNRQEYSSINEREEVYYKNGYTYTFNKIRNTKTKEKADFESLKTQGMVEGIMPSIKKLLKAEYIGSKSGEKQGRTGSKSTKCITVLPDISKVNTERVLGGNLSNITIEFYFNEKDEFTYFSLNGLYSHSNDLEKVYCEIGKLDLTVSIPFPEDLDNYK